MKTKILRMILYGILGYSIMFLLTYLSGVYVSMEFNPLNWPSEGRYFQVSVSFFGIIFALFGDME